MNDLSRTVSDSIKQLLQQFPCVAILGARQVGKSTLLKQLLPNASFFDLESTQDYEQVQRDPLFFIQNQPNPLILDEAQLLPALFPALRVAIDQNRKIKGQFLISGSSSPDLIKNISESLAGRIALVELGTLTIEESWKEKASPFFEIFNTKSFSDLRNLKPRMTIQQLLTSCLYGGYPEPFLNRDQPDFVSRWMDNYFATYINRDVRKLFPGLNMDNYTRFIKMLAFSSAQIINYSQFAHSLDTSQPTARSYFEIAEGTYLWRTRPSFQKTQKKRLLKMPKGHLRDSGLINHMLRIRTIGDLQGHPSFGGIWETFIIEHLIKSFKNSLISCNTCYYRTHDNAEIDLVLEGDFGLIPIEIKSGTTVPTNRLQTLRKFVEEFQCPAGIVISNAEKADLIAPNIYQVPASCL